MRQRTKKIKSLPLSTGYPCKTVMKLAAALSLTEEFKKSKNDLTSRAHEIVNILRQL